MQTRFLDSVTSNESSFTDCHLFEEGANFRQGKGKDELIELRAEGFPIPYQRGNLPCI